MAGLLARLLRDSETGPAAIPAIPANIGAKTAQESQNRKNRTGSESEKAVTRTWAQWDGSRWHGVAVGPGWWQWCGSYRTLTEALQAAERVRS